MDYSSLEYKLESLYAVQGFILGWLSRAETESAKKEWRDKLEANQKEIERVSKLKD